MYTEENEPQRRYDQYEGPALPKAVLAEAYGYTIRELYIRIKNEIGEGYNHAYKKFSPLEVQEIMEHFGFNPRWSVITRYINSLGK